MTGSCTHPLDPARVRLTRSYQQADHSRPGGLGRYAWQIAHTKLRVCPADTGGWQLDALGAPDSFWLRDSGLAGRTFPTRAHALQEVCAAHACQPLKLPAPPCTGAGPKLRHVKPGFLRTSCRNWEALRNRHGTWTVEDYIGQLSLGGRASIADCQAYIDAKHASAHVLYPDQRQVSGRTAR